MRFCLESNLKLRSIKKPLFAHPLASEWETRKKNCRKLWWLHEPWKPSMERNWAPSLDRSKDWQHVCAHLHTRVVVWRPLPPREWWALQQVICCRATGYLCFSTTGYFLAQSFYFRRCPITPFIRPWFSCSSRKKMPWQKSDVILVACLF